MKYKNDLQGKKMKLSGIVVEHLIYGKKEWVKLELSDGNTIMINVVHCEKVDDDWEEKAKNARCITCGFVRSIPRGCPDCDKD